MTTQKMGLDHMSVNGSQDTDQFQRIRERVLKMVRRNEYITIQEKYCWGFNFFKLSRMKILVLFCVCVCVCLIWSLC